VFYAASSSSGGNYTLLLMMVVLFGAMYFLMIRPQQRRRREMEAMQSSIGPGEEVITVGGLYGKVVDMDDETITLEVAPGVTNRFARGAINRVVPKPGVADSTTDPGTEDVDTTADEKVDRD